jgi:hypothetical protein
MKKKIASFAFNISLPVFIVLARAKTGFMRRDLVEFQKYGLTEAILTAIDTMTTEFEAIPTDEELLGDQVIATQEKDAQALKVKEILGSIMTRAANKFGAESGKYRKFGVWEISTLDGGKLSYTASRALRVAKGYLTELESEGLTQAILTDFEAMIQTYNTKLGVQEDAISNRDIASENRAEKANAIYRLISKHCETGKQIWASTNEAKYNDYVIYDTPSGSPEKEAPAA